MVYRTIRPMRLLDPRTDAPTQIGMHDILLHIPTSPKTRQFFLVCGRIVMTQGWSTDNLVIEGFIESA